jgi:hypothetical protein
VVKRREQRPGLGIAGTALDRDRALGGGRDEAWRAQALADAFAQAQPLQAGGGQDDGVVIAGIELGQTGIDVAAQVAQLQVGPVRPQQGLAAQRGGADDGAVGQLLEGFVLHGDESIVRRGALQHGRQLEAGLQLHRHVLERVHGGVGATFQHRHLQLLEEQALAADLRQRLVQHLVAAGGHGHQLDLQAGMGFAQAGRHVFGLPQGQGTFPGGEADLRHVVPLKDA